MCLRCRGHQHRTRKTTGRQACFSVFLSASSRVRLSIFKFFSLFFVSKPLWVCRASSQPLSPLCVPACLHECRDFPSSFHGVHGQIEYTLTVSIHRPWHLSKDFVTELNFVNHVDTNKPDLWVRDGERPTLQILDLHTSSIDRSFSRTN